MKHVIYIIIGVAAAVTLASCSKQGDAERLVREFVAQNAVAPDELVTLGFGNLDSTKVIRDSLVLDMRTRDNPLFKKHIDYPVRTSGRMLYFLRTTFACKNDTVQHTFYMDETLERVVAFK